MVSARALTSHPLRALIIEDDEDEVEIVSAPIPTIPVSTSTSIVPARAPRKLSTLVQAKAKKKGKAPMTFAEPEETPQDEEYIHVTVDVRKTASTLKSKGLAKKMVKMILFSRDWEDRKPHPIEEIIKSFFLAIVKVSILPRIILRVLKFQLIYLDKFSFSIVCP